MNKYIGLFLTVLLFAVPAAHAAGKNPVVRLTTTLGAIEIELYPAKAPATVNNFLGYVKSGFYDGTIFHRVIPGFMIQGGGFAEGMREQSTRAPIRNEADNGLKNKAGTIAMARTMNPHSAAAQFFINTVDNAFLDHRDRTPQGWGYCVFGKVRKGMDVVRRIEKVPTGDRGPHQNVPLTEVVVTKAEIVRPVAKSTTPQAKTAEPAAEKSGEK